MYVLIIIKKKTLGFNFSISVYFHLWISATIELDPFKNIGLSSEIISECFSLKVEYGRDRKRKTMHVQEQSFVVFLFFGFSFSNEYSLALCITL